MASNQVDVPKDDILKCINLIVLTGKWVKFSSTSDLKQEKERFWSHHMLIFNINLSLHATELLHFCIYNV